MSKQMVAQLQPGQTVEAPFAVSHKSLIPFKSRPGKYLAITLTDKTGSIAARVWENAEQISQQCRVGDIVAVTGRVEEYRGSMQIIVNHCRPCDESEFEKDDFLPSGKKDHTELLEKISGYITRVENEYLRELLEVFFSDPEFVAAFSQSPGAKALHHSHLGGLLEHTVGVVAILLTVQETHPELDRDLLISGALLHDIGKLKELQAEHMIDYTDTGRLVGHIVHTDRMVTRAIEKIDGFPPELADQLSHILLSHHGQKEYGAPVVPMTAEACALHYADNLDAHVQYFQQVIDHGLQTGNRWSEYQQLFDRYIYIGDGHDRGADE
ncbi:MAG: 3'-5' exoribonuclease YhaM family protein [Armatimonadota bacterium]